MIKLTSCGRPKDVTQGVLPLGVLGRSEDACPRLKEYAVNNILVTSTHIWRSKTET